MLKPATRVTSSWGLGTAIALIGCCVATFYGNPTSAQITSDGTLGAERSIVKPNVTIKGSPADGIDGGATRGANLFHSFREFNVKDGQRVYFANPAGIKNILSRVTGANLSDIQGTLGVDGRANLFLLNPNGIVFGPNASLDIAGSFVASTASSLKFVDDTQFSTTHASTMPLLTMSVPIGLQYGENPGRILVQGDGQGLRTTNELIDTTVGLRVPPNQTLALVGGDVVLEGGMLKTAGGRIELGSVAEPGLVSLNPTKKGLSLGYEGIPTFGDIRLSQQAVVDASGAGGGDVQVHGRQLRLQDGSRIEASTLGAEQGGTLSVTTSKSVEAISTSANGEFASGLFADVEEGAIGNGGNLTLETGQLILRDGAAVSAATFGEGSGGTLAVKARESVELIGESADGQFGSYLFTSVEEGATGDGGNLTLETEQLIIRDGAVVDASTFGEGDAGSLTVKAHESVEVIGRRADAQLGSGLFTSVEEGATGDGGNLAIATRQLIVRDGAQIGAGTFGEGDAGSLTVKAHESVELIGKSALDSRFRSGLFTSVQLGATGDGGNLTIETGRLIVRDGAQIGAGTSGEGAGGDLAIATRQLIVRDGAQIGASTSGEGDAGSLTVNARESVEVTADDGQFPSGLFTAVAEGATGDGGNLTIETGRLIVRDGAQIAAATFGKQDAGSLDVEARESVEVSGESADGQLISGLFVSTYAAGDAGDLKIQTGRLNIRDRAKVTASSLGSGKAGNLQVQARSIGLDNQGAIIATTTSGNGGNITLQAQDLLLLRNTSQISTEAGIEEETPGTGGSITIDTNNLVALEDSDIDADAFGGSGGQVFINAQGNFRSPDSDITATSNLGPQFSGTVQINTPDVDPSQELANLPTEPVNTEIAQDCQADSGKGTSRFISSGSGGLPTNPYEPLDSRDILADVQAPTQWGSNPLGAARADASAQTKTDRIVEAQGWSINKAGEVVLVSQVPHSVSQKGCRLH